MIFSLNIGATILCMSRDSVSPVCWIFFLYYVLTDIYKLIKWVITSLFGCFNLAPMGDAKYEQTHRQKNITHIQGTSWVKIYTYPEERIEEKMVQHCTTLYNNVKHCRKLYHTNIPSITKLSNPLRLRCYLCKNVLIKKKN